jgi:hypothetical protein
MNWWYPCKVKGSARIKTPDKTRKAVQAEKKPKGLWWGPYHCSDCANLCASFGFTESHAFDALHKGNSW